MSLDLVYEIGTEEIPAGYLPSALRQLRAAAEKFVAENELACESIEVQATPRRLVLFLRGLPEGQEDRTEEVTGPPWKAAFDADGNPTKALLGFAKGRGLDPSEVREVETERGPYVGATVTIRGRETKDLLAEALPAMTQSLQWPKTMRFGPERFRFPRPIRWLLALLGGNVVPFAIEGVETGRLTYGHRILARGPFEVSDPSQYEAALEKGQVRLRQADRGAEIERLLAEAAQQVGGELVPDPSLVEEVSYLVETPSAFVGSFDAEYLELPAPVITTAMRDHQRYFALTGDDGELLPRFLCVANSAPDAVDQVMNGNQRVLRARLDDARFYWNEDLKTTLEQKVPSLGSVVWLEGFGSLEDKTHRIERLVAHLAANAADDVKATAARAALLAKTDLVTEMIRDGKEFTALQGVIGREYAAQNGEPEAVGQALEEQYRPRFAGDDLPEGEAGAWLAVADRIDTIVGVWAAGMKPTGSKDPFALRRSSLGVIRIVLDRQRQGGIEGLLEFAIAGYGDAIQKPAEVLAEASAFVRDRLAGHLVDEGFDADIVAAAVEAAGADPLDAHARVRAISALRSERAEDFDALAAGFKRAKNILKKGAEAGEPSADLLVEDAERALFEAFTRVDAAVAAAEKERRYSEALTDLAGLRAPIDAFFDSVHVMADDENVRKNRLRLLGRIVGRIQGIADLSRITPPEERNAA